MTIKALLIRIGADVSDFKAKMNQLEKGIDKHKGKIQKGLNKISLAVVGIGIAAGKASIDFNKSMANIATLIPGNIKRVEELKESVQDLSVETGKSTSDIAAGLYQVISAFGDTSDTVKILDTNVRAAAAGLATTTDAINLTSAVTKGYGDTTAEAVKKASDLAFVTVKLGQTTFPELASSIGKVIPFAQAMKVSQEELFAGFAALTGVTGNAAEVSTQFKGILGAMVTPTEAMTEALKQTGYATHGAMIEDLGLQGALKRLKEETDGTIIGMGKLFAEKEGLIGVTALLGAQEEAYTEKLGEMVKGAGAGAEAYGEMTKGINKTGHAFDRAKASVVVMLQKLGDELSPIILKIADEITKFTQRISTLIKGFKKLPKPIKSVILGFGGLLALSAPLFKMFMMMRTGLGGVDKLMGTKLAPSLVRVAGRLKKLPAIGMAAFIGWKIGRTIGEITGLDKVVQNVAGSLLDTVGYAKGMNVEWDKIPGHTERAAKAQDIFAAASKLAGEEVTTLKGAAAILGEQYKKTGTAGSEMLDAWLKKVGLAQGESDKLKKETEKVGKAAKGSKQPIIDLKEIASDLGVVLKDDLVLELKNTEKWLAEFSKTTKLTPAGVQTLKDRIKELKTELGLLGKEAKVAGSDLIAGIFAPAVYDAIKAIKELDEKAEAAGVTMRTKLEKELENTIETFEDLAKQGQFVTDDQRKMVDDIIALHIKLGEEIPPKWKQMYEDLKVETVDTVDFMDTTWGQFLGGIADSFGDMVSNIKIEGGKLKIDFNTLWGDIKLGFKQTISDMVSDFLKNFVNSIVTGATTAGAASATLAGGLTTLGSGIAGLAKGVASVLPAVATAIATAAQTLLSALPAIVAVGAAAIALYAGFMAVNKLLGKGGGSKAMDATNRILEKIWETTQIAQLLLRDQTTRWEADLSKQDAQTTLLQGLLTALTKKGTVYVDVFRSAVIKDMTAKTGGFFADLGTKISGDLSSLGSGIADGLGRVGNKIGETGVDVSGIVSAIKKGYGNGLTAAGGLHGRVLKPTPLLVHPHEDIQITPDKDLLNSAAAGTPAGDTFSPVLNISTLDAKSMRDMIRGKLGEEILLWLETKMPKTRFQRALS